MNRFRLTLLFLGLVSVLVPTQGVRAFDNQANLMATIFPHWLVRSKELYEGGKYQDTQFEFIDVSDSHRLSSKVYLSGFFGFSNYDNYRDPLDFAFSDSRVFVFQHSKAEVRVFSWNAEGDLEFDSSFTVPVQPIPTLISQDLAPLMPGLSSLLGAQLEPTFKDPRILFAFEGPHGVYFVVGMTILVGYGQYTAGESFRLVRWSESGPLGLVETSTLADPDTQAIEDYLISQMETHETAAHYPSVDELKLHTAVALWQREGGDLAKTQDLAVRVSAMDSLWTFRHLEWNSVAEVLGDRVYFPDAKAFSLESGELTAVPEGVRTTNTDLHVTGTTFWWQHFFRLDGNRALLVNDFGKQAQLWVDDTSGPQISSVTIPGEDFGRPPTHWARSSDGHWFFLAAGGVRELWAPTGKADLEFYQVNDERLAGWIQAEDKENLEKAYSFFVDPAPALQAIQKSGKSTLAQWFFQAITSNHPGTETWASANPVFQAIESRDMASLQFFLASAKGLANLRSNSWRGQGTSPLAAAAQAGNAEACRLLLSAGADVKAGEGGGVFPRNALSSASTVEARTLLRAAGVPQVLAVDLKGKLIDTHVRLRTAPSLTAPVLKILEKNEPVTIREVTAESILLDKKSGPWLHVLDSQGIDGWVWAPFVDNRDWYDN